MPRVPRDVSHHCRDGTLTEAAVAKDAEAQKELEHEKELVLLEDPGVPTWQRLVVNVSRVCAAQLLRPARDAGERSTSRVPGGASA